MIKKLGILFLVILISSGIAMTMTTSEVNNLIQKCKIHLSEAICNEMNKNLNDPNTPEFVKQSIKTMIMDQISTMEQEKSETQKRKQAEQEKRQQELVKQQTEEEKIKAALTPIQGKFYKFFLETVDVRDENVKILDGTAQYIKAVPRLFVPSGSVSAPYKNRSTDFSALEDECTSASQTGSIVTLEEFKDIMKRMDSNTKKAIERISFRNGQSLGLLIRGDNGKDKYECHFSNNLTMNNNTCFKLTPMIMVGRYSTVDYGVIKPVSFATFCKL